MKRICALLAAVLCLTAAGRGSAEKYNAMPEIFIFRQFSISGAQNGALVSKTYPDCANDQVDADMRALIDQMSDRAAADTRAAAPSALDTGAYVFRAGESAMSFLTVSYAVKGERQVYAAFDARAYDLADGKRLALTDLIAPDGAAWQTLADAVRNTVTAYFPGTAPDAAALDAACAREALENAAFTLTPARLTLHYTADTFYPGRSTLIHVPLAHSLWRDSMTETAKKQTDASHFRYIALTYDDGPIRGRTEQLIDVLREFGANATFFGVGEYFSKCADLLCRQHDALFAVESHSYRHVYDIDVTTAIQYADKVDGILSSIIGVGPSMMRAPGGDHTKYRQGKVQLPFIGWNVMSDDSDATDAGRVARRVIRLAKDGAVVLMHDRNRLAPTYSREILTALEQQGFLCVTVAELYEIYGIPLTPNLPYNGTDTTKAAERNP